MTDDNLQLFRLKINESIGRLCALFVFEEYPKGDKLTMFEKTILDLQEALQILKDEGDIS